MLASVLALEASVTMKRLPQIEAELQAIAGHMDLRRSESLAASLANHVRYLLDLVETLAAGLQAAIVEFPELLRDRGEVIEARRAAKEAGASR